MRLRKLADCEEIIAGDGTALRELLHPDRDYPFSGRYSLAHASIRPGEASVPHSLKSCEIYYILFGQGKMHVADECEIVTKGDVIEIPAGENQWIENTGSTNLAFLCIVDPAWRKEDEEITGR